MDRYTRQKMIKGWDQKALKGAQVLVVGAGTTGNEVIKNLALLGVGRIAIIDTDKVEKVNLNRSVLFRDLDIDQYKSITAARRARELNPDIVADGWTCNAVFGLGNRKYRDFNCVILTVDNLEARMWVNRYCWLNNVPLIDTGIDGLVGNVFVMIPPLESCIECGWGNREYQNLFEKYSCLKKGLEEEDRKIPMVITTAAAIGGIAVQECVGILHRHVSDISRRAGSVFQYDGETRSSLSWRVPRKEDCPGHLAAPDESRVLFEASLDQSVDCIKENVRTALGAAIVELWYDKEIVYTVVCSESCEYTETIGPCALGQFKRSLCPICSKLSLVPGDQTEELRDGHTLKSLGVPSNHLLRVDFSRNEAISDDAIDRAWIVSK